MRKGTAARGRGLLLPDMAAPVPRANSVTVEAARRPAPARDGGIRGGGNDNSGIAGHFLKRRPVDFLPKVEGSFQRSQRRDLFQRDAEIGVRPGTQAADSGGLPERRWVRIGNFRRRRSCGPHLREGCSFRLPGRQTADQRVCLVFNDHDRRGVEISPRRRFIEDGTNLTAQVQFAERLLEKRRTGFVPRAQWQRRTPGVAGSE